MIKFEKIKSGITLYDVRKNNQRWLHGNKFEVFPVTIIEVDEKERRVLASWNHNKPEWMHEYRITRFRANKPK